MWGGPPLLFTGGKTDKFREGQHIRLRNGLDTERIAAAFRQLPEVESVQTVPRPAPPPGR